MSTQLAYKLCEEEMSDCACLATAVDVISKDSRV